MKVASLRERLDSSTVASLSWLRRLLPDADAVKTAEQANNSLDNFTNIFIMKSWCYGVGVSNVIFVSAIEIAIL